MVHSNGLILTSSETHLWLSWLSFSDQSEISSSPLYTRQSIMTEGQCAHIVTQDPYLGVRAPHEDLGLFLGGDIETLVVDALESVLDHSILFPSASSTLLYKSVFFMLILSPSIITFCGTPFAALCTTCFSSTRQYIWGLSPTNSVMRYPLCSSLKMGPDNF